MEKRVLLHICCGVCTLYCIERLKREGFSVTGFFFNPNIHPYDEYERRRDVTYEVGRITAIEIIEGAYDDAQWMETCGAYGGEREGGRRCYLCYEMRLRRALQLLKERNFDYFSTTLTISPHKDSKAVITIGQNLDRERFLAIDFKKKDGFKRTLELARQYNLNRQNYCGCVFSYTCKNGFTHSIGT